MPNSQPVAQVNRPVLQRGAQGEAVKELQRLLKQRVSSTLVVDGIFGEMTELIVKVFQFRMLLAQDGVVGPQTWQALMAGEPVGLPLLRRGSQGEQVSRAQNVLRFRGAVGDQVLTDGYYKGAIDGIFGPQMEAAVRAFQQDKKLRVDGTIGNQTWKALSLLASEVSHVGL